MEWGTVSGLGRIKDAGIFDIPGKHESGATTALLRMCDAGVEIVLGVPALSMSGIRTIKRELVTFDEAPELRNLWSLAGWRMSEVNCLLSTGQAPTVKSIPLAAVPASARPNGSPA